MKLNCPFCGSPDISVSKATNLPGNPPSVRYYVECLECEAMGPMAVSHRKASDAWDAAHVSEQLRIAARECEEAWHLLTRRKGPTKAELDALAAKMAMVVYHASGVMPLRPCGDDIRVIK